MKFKSFGFSDPGRIRHNNEDNYLCNEKERLFLVADGMGGHASGETASKLAVNCIEEFVVRSRSGDTNWPEEYREDLTLEQNRLLFATSFANRHILEIADQDPSLEGMGTTIAGVIIEDEHQLAILNVGDSRLYRVRDKKIRQLTMDHTLVGEQEREGVLTKEEVWRHPHRHILTSALGTSENPKIDVFLSEIMPEDLYLICSDGLHDMLKDNEILDKINSIKDKSLYKIGLSLVLEANLTGGKDNITVVLLSF
ncbi:MAG: PP2C family serine/threonine-protein phosphatase [Thermodesulfobacteriota bacterium]|nr:PP2C family serine/threonine-protein phosphatase [Thermodesulfobacteriota bacterium]